MRPRLVLASLSCALVATSALAQSQRQRPDESWGKPGVSYLQYRTDAVECAYRAGQDAPVSYPTVDLLFFDNTAHGGDATATMHEAIAAFDVNARRMSRPWREISAQVQPALARCLSDRGYRRFRLTRDQAAKLRDLPIGGKARHTFLWAIAAAPEIRTDPALQRR